MLPAQPGRAYYQKKLTEGNTGKEALCARKRQISDAIFACLQADARRAAATGSSPASCPSRPRSPASTCPNILAKLGVSTRTEAAATVHRLYVLDGQ